MASLEDNQQLIDGATVLAAGQTLGLDHDETIQVANSKREKVRENIRRRRADRAAREGNRAQAEAYLAKADADFQAKGGLTPFERQLAVGSNVRADIDDEGYAFGESPQLIVDDSGRRVEMEPRRPQDDDHFAGASLPGGKARSPEEREIMVRNDVLGEDFLTPDERNRQKEGRNVLIGGKRPQVAKVGRGEPAMLDALARLQQAKDQYGFAAFGAEGVEMERLYNRLQERVEGGAVRKDRKEARKAILADAQRRRGDVSDEAIISAADRAVQDHLAGRETNYDVGPGLPAIRRHPINRVVSNTPEVQPNLTPAGLQQNIVEEMAGRRADAVAGGPEQRAADNSYNARKEGVLKRGRDGGYPQRVADQAIENIPNIIQLGAAGPAAHGVLREDNIRFGSNASSFDAAIPELGPTGSPVAYFGNVKGEFQELGRVNAPDTGTTLNAPKATPLMQFVAEHQPLYGRNNVFGEPQVEINDLMGLIGDRVRGLKGYGYEGVGNPRNLAEVEQMLGAVVKRGQSLGDQFYRYDEELGKQINVANPGVAEVFGKLRINPAQQQNIAYALMQIEQANALDVNQGDKAAFAGRVNRPLDERVQMGAAAMRADGGTPIDMINNEKVGRGKKRQGARAALAAINDEPLLQALNERGELFTTAQVQDNKGNVREVQVLLPEAARAIEGARQARNDAQMPMQGAIRGEGAARARFVSPAGRKMSYEQLAAKYGPANAAIAQGVMDRYDRDEAARAASPIDPGAEIQRRKDSDAAAMGKRAERDFEDKEIGELVKLMKYGRQSPGLDRFVMEGDRPVINAAGEQINKPQRIPGQQRGEVLRVPSNLDFKQPIRKAAVPMSTAPTPGAGTGSQDMPMVDAGGAGAQPPTRTAVSGGPMPDDMRKELFSLPRTKISPMEKEMAMRQIDRGARNEKIRNRAALGGSTLAGLAGILGLSNINKEEEEATV